MHGSFTALKAIQALNPCFAVLKNCLVSYISSILMGKPTVLYNKTLNVELYSNVIAAPGVVILIV